MTDNVKNITLVTDQTIYSQFTKRNLSFSISISCLLVYLPWYEIRLKHNFCDGLWSELKRTNSKQIIWSFFKELTDHWDSTTQKGKNSWQLFYSVLLSLRMPNTFLFSDFPSRKNEERQSENWIGVTNWLKKIWNVD